MVNKKQLLQKIKEYNKKQSKIKTTQTTTSKSGKKYSKVLPVSTLLSNYNKMTGSNIELSKKKGGRKKKTA